MPMSRPATSVSRPPCCRRSRKARKSRRTSGRQRAALRPFRPLLRGAAEARLDREAGPALHRFGIVINLARRAPVVHRLDGAVLQREGEPLAALRLPDRRALGIRLEPDLVLD